MPRVKKVAVEKKSSNLVKNIIVKNNLPHSDEQETLPEFIAEVKAPILKTSIKRKAQTKSTKNDAAGETPNKINKTATKNGGKHIDKKAAFALYNGEVEDDSNLISLAVGVITKPEPIKKRGRPLKKLADNGELSLKQANNANVKMMSETNKKNTTRKVTTKRKLGDNVHSIEDNVDPVEEKIIQKGSEEDKISKATRKKVITSTKKAKAALEFLSNNLEIDEEKTKINNGKDTITNLDELPKSKRTKSKKQNETIPDTMQDDGRTTQKNSMFPRKKTEKSKIIEAINLGENETKCTNNKNRIEKMVVKEVSETLQMKNEIKNGKKVKTNRKKAVANDDRITNQTANSAVATVEKKFEDGKLGIKGNFTTRTRTEKRNNAATVKGSVIIENLVGKQEEENAVKEVEEEECIELVKKGEKDAKRKLMVTCGLQLNKFINYCLTVTNKIKRKPNTKSTDQPLNKTVTIYNEADFELKFSHGDYDDNGGQPIYNLKVSSWNVAGLRSWVSKGGLKYLEYEKPDIFCMQETKCTTEQLPPEVSRIAGYHPYWLCMPGGYAGVAIYSKIMPINVEYGIGNEEFDSVGRLMTAEYEKFFLINVYVPNSGRKLVNLDVRMQWEKLFQEFVQKLDKRKPLIICGDMNVSHKDIDLANPKSNTRNAGFTREERERMSELLALGFVDTFRHLYPNRTSAYTYWTYMGNARSRNVGWRLDYFIVSQRLVKCVIENCMRAQCLGSDHCPITLYLKL